MSDAQPIRYKVARTTLQLCGLLGLDPDALLRRMRRPPDFFEDEGRGVTAQEYFDGWNAIIAEAGRDDAPLLLGQAYARGPFNPAFFAFTCSPNVAVGLERLTLFKPLTGPLHLAMRRDDSGALRITKTTNMPGLPLPASFAATELVFFAEAMRTCTGAPLRPLAATLPAAVPAQGAIEDFLGCPITISAACTMTLSPEDAARPLLSSDAEHWATIEPGFRRQMYALTDQQTTTGRLRAVLTEMLPAGEANVMAAADRMRMSARSLQRRLNEEGTTFQAELDAVREALAREYLIATDLNIEEISYLLAYRDPNSFYRAFQSWTGHTPGTLRGSA